MSNDATSLSEKTARYVKRLQQERDLTGVKNFLQELAFFRSTSPDHSPKAPDLGKDHARFVLVAAFTWPTGLKGDDLEELPEEDDEDDFPGWEENEEKPKEEIGSQKPGAKKRGRAKEERP